MTKHKAVIVGVLLWLISRGRGASAATKSVVKSGKGENKQEAADDGQKLVLRANQTAAQSWEPLFLAQDATDRQSRELARWAGIESSGDATAVSSLGERGLLQLGKGMVKDGALTSAEFDQLISPATTREEHARLNFKIVKWLVARVAKHVDNFPTDGSDQIWYAKLYHQRPVDVRDGHMHGPAALMARELALRWAKDPKAMHRLRAANVVAWNTPDPPEAP